MPQLTALSDAQRIADRALRLLADREHSVLELRRKLTACGAARELVETVLVDLVRQGLQSDARFAEQYTRVRIAKGFGLVRIRAELRERGLDTALIAASLNTDDAVWLPRLTQIHDQKFGHAPPANRSDWARRARFLTTRGFTTAQVRRFLRFDDSQA